MNQFESMEHFTTILPNGTVQIPPSMLKDLGFEPGMSIELHTISDVLEVRPALKQPKANIYFGCMKDQTVMHDDLIAPTDVESYEPYSTLEELRKEIELADKNSCQELKNLGFAKDSLKIVGEIITSPHFDEVITCADSCESEPTIESTKKRA